MKKLLFITFFFLVVSAKAQVELPSWSEEFQVEAFPTDNKEILSLRVKNSGKNKKDCLQKAKEQAIYQTIYVGYKLALGDQYQSTRIINPLPFLEKLDATDEKNGLNVFIKKTGHSNILEAEIDDNVDGVKNEDKSKSFVSIIKLNHLALTEQLEQLDLKRTFIEELGFKPKVLFLPTDFISKRLGKFGENIIPLLNDSEFGELRSDYNKQYDLINATLGKSIELINLFSLKEKLLSELALNKEKSVEFKEKEIEILARNYIGNSYLFLSREEMRGRGGQEIQIQGNLNLSNDPNSFEFQRVGFCLRKILGDTKTIDFELIQNILITQSDVINNSVFMDLIKQKGQTRETAIFFSCNKRLKKKVDEKINYNGNQLSLYDVSKEYFNSKGIKSIAQGFGSDKLIVSYENFKDSFITQKANFTESFTAYVLEKTGFTVDIDFIGNEKVFIELTDMKRLERKRKIKSDYDAAVSQKSMELHRQFLVNFSDTEYYTEMLGRYNNLISEKAKSKLTNEEFTSLLKDEYCTTSKKEVATNFVQSLIPTNWNEINTLQGINDLIRTINSACSANNLDPNLKTEYKYSVSDFSSAGKWTFENLNVSHFANGDTIYEARTNEEWIKANNDKKPAWCFYNNEKNESNKLYNFYAITDTRGLALGNYAIPTINDFQALVNNLGGNSVAGRKMKANWLWGEEEVDDEVYGFAARPIGYRNEHGVFVGGELDGEYGEYCGLWSTTENGNLANAIFLQKNKVDVLLANNINKSWGLAVRLIEKSPSQSPYKLTMNSLDEIRLKRDQLILNQFQVTKNTEDMQPLFFTQIKEEMAFQNVTSEEIDWINYHNIYQRIWNNEKLVKSGLYLAYFDYVPQPFYGADGEANDPNPISKIGFTNNVENYQEFEDGSIYKGSIVDGSFDGQGVLTLGEFTESWGYGEMELSKGDKFEGTFKDGDFVNGKITFKNKSIYEGECSGFQPHGQGKLTLAGGKVLQGKFENGSYIKPFSCKEAKIGNQTWMAENLKVTKFRNGEEIQEARSAEEWRVAGESKQPAFCYYNNDPSTVDKYGVLYNYFALVDHRGLAPEGWSLPSHHDVQSLREYLSSEIITKQNLIENQQKNGINTDKTFNELNSMFTTSLYFPTMEYKLLPGFNKGAKYFLPSVSSNKFYGYRNDYGEFQNKSDEAIFWTTSIVGNNGYVMKFSEYGTLNSHSTPELLYTGGWMGNHWLKYTNDNTSKIEGLPIRCIKQ